MTGIPETPGDVLDSEFFNKSSTSSKFISVKSKLEDIFVILKKVFLFLKILHFFKEDSIRLLSQNKLLPCNRPLVKLYFS